MKKFHIHVAYRNSLPLNGYVESGSKAELDTYLRAIGYECIAIEEIEIKDMYSIPDPSALDSLRYAWNGCR